MEIWVFLNFSFGFVVNPIAMKIFNILGHLEVPKHFWDILGAPGSAPGWIFLLFFLWFRGKPYHQAKFKHSRISGSAFKRIWGILGAPGSAPGWKFGVFLIFLW